MGRAPLRHGTYPTFSLSLIATWTLWPAGITRTSNIATGRGKLTRSKCISCETALIIELFNFWKKKTAKLSNIPYYIYVLGAWNKYSHLDCSSIERAVSWSLRLTVTSWCSLCMIRDYKSRKSHVISKISHVYQYVQSAMLQIILYQFIK